jgi:periplasmic copper chaperone A
MVAWNQVAVDDAAEPERPAPVLTVTAPASDPAAVGAADPGTAATDAAPASAPTADAEDDTSSALPTGISVVALLVALGALASGLKRRTV